ncbi:MAG TPA: outer membrane beta-barrel protein, partial [Burkholderiales bacterium]|nr:outer membrane beta-barrel protein [Burkholderiales bacterium]
PVPVSVNAQNVGALSNGSFLTVTVDPGRTFLRTGDRVVTTLRLDVEANRSYFVRVDVVHGVSTVQTDLRLMSEADGRRALTQGGVPPPAAAAPPPSPAVQPQAIAPPPPRPTVQPQAIAPPPPRPTVQPQAIAPPPPRPAAQPQAIAPPPPRPAAQPLVIAAPPPAPPAAKPKPKPKPKPAVEEEEYGLGRDWEIALLPKLGTFKMANADQTVGTAPSTYDTSSKSVFSIEAEWRNKSGLALGGEIFSYRNQLTQIQNGTKVSPQQATLVATINAKYYFSTGIGLHPFAGAGIGFANATYSSNLSGSASGLALQGMAGLEYRFEHVGIYAEYKYLVSTVGSGEKIKVGGSGILAGVSILF